MKIILTESQYKNNKKYKCENEKFNAELIKFAELYESPNFNLEKDNIVPYCENQIPTQTTNFYKCNLLKQGGGNIDYHEKYIKYKTKYLNLLFYKN